MDLFKNRASGINEACGFRVIPLPFIRAQQNTIKGMKETSKWDANTGRHIQRYEQ